MTTLATDPYTRTTSPGLGSEPVTGQAYQYVPADTTFSTTGTAAQVTTPSVAQVYYATVPVGRTDMNVRVFHTLPVLPAGGPITLRAVARWENGNNFYNASVSIAPTTGTATLSLTKSVAGTGTVINAGVTVGTHAAGNTWGIDLQVVGNLIRARAWNTTGAEPTTWQVTAVDASLVLGTQAGWGVRRETGNSNGTVTLTTDNLSVESMITVIQQDVYPPRTQITLPWLQVGDSVAIYRSVAGVRTLVQGSVSAGVTDVAFFRIDGTLPFGVPVQYVGVINGAETVSPAFTYTLPGGKVALSDPISALAAEVIVLSWPRKTRGRDATVYSANGENVVVMGDLTLPESDVELYTEAFSSTENLQELLENATQGIVMIRQPGGYEGVDGFFVVTSYEERRFSRDGSDDRRIHALHVVEVTGYADAFQALGFTYADLATIYSGLTYANLQADFPNYIALTQADLS